MMADVSAADYIDSSGVASLVEALQCACSNGLESGLVGVSEVAMKSLHLARLGQVFGVYASMEDRLAGRG